MIFFTALLWQDLWNSTHLVRVGAIFLHATLVQYQLVALGATILRNLRLGATVGVTWCRNLCCILALLIYVGTKLVHTQSRCTNSFVGHRCRFYNQGESDFSSLENFEMIFRKNWRVWSGIMILWCALHLCEQDGDQERYRIADHWLLMGSLRGLLLRGVSRREPVS